MFYAAAIDEQGNEVIERSELQDGLETEGLVEQRLAEYGYIQGDDEIWVRGDERAVIVAG